MRLVAICGAVLFLAGVLVGAYSCLEYQRASQAPDHDVEVVGVLVATGSPGEILALAREEYPALSEALAGMPADSTVWLVSAGEHLPLDVCAFSRGAPLPPLGSEVRVAGHYHHSHGADTPRPVRVLLGCERVLER